MSMEAEFTGSQSSDGLTDTFTDTSPYVANGYTPSDFVRTMVISDAWGDVLQTTIIDDSEDTVEFEITEDTYVTVVLTIVGPATYTKTYSFPTFYRLSKNLYKTLLNAVGCSCGNTVTENALNTADRLFRGADLAGISGDGPGWQNSIDSAYTILNQYPT